MAKLLRFGRKRIGGKVGYDQSLITAITQRLNDAVAYENALKEKTPQKALKQPKMGDYYTYNGERDNKDYEWEKNENRNMKKIIRLTEQDLHNIVKESVTKILEERLVPYNDIMQLYDTGSYNPEEIADELGEDLEYVNWCIDNFDWSDFQPDEFPNDEYYG